ncbi:MAG TPA: hypothetical protein VIU12_25315, partial [Chryseolinea sp.]
MLENYEAVDAPKASAIYRYPVQKLCPVSCGIKASDETQESAIRYLEWVRREGFNGTPQAPGTRLPGSVS